MSDRVPIECASCGESAYIAPRCSECMEQAEWNARLEADRAFEPAVARLTADNIALNAQVTALQADSTALRSIRMLLGLSGATEPEHVVKAIEGMTGRIIRDGGVVTVDEDRDDTEEQISRHKPSYGPELTEWNALDERHRVALGLDGSEPNLFEACRLADQKYEAFRRWCSRRLSEMATDGKDTNAAR